MQGDIFFSEARKGYNKQEVEAFLKRVDEENSEVLQAKDDEHKRLLNEKDAMQAEYERRLAELETELKEKTAKCEENAAKYEELCANMGEKLLFAESQASKIIADANAKKIQIERDAAERAEQYLADVSAKARNDAAAVLRAVEVLKQKSTLINAGLDQTRRILDDAIAQIEKAAAE